MIHQRLRKCRQAIGFSMADAAMRTGMPLERLEAIEAGQVIPDPLEIQMLVRSYGHSFGDFSLNWQSAV